MAIKISGTTVIDDSRNITNLGSALTVAQGGTGVTTSTGTGATVRSTSPALVTPALGTPSSGTLTNATGLPIVAGTTGTLSAARGGTGNTNGSAATLTTARTIGGVSFNGSANINLPGVNTAGNQNTTGTAANVTGTVAVARGGTGQTSYTNGQLLIGNTTGNTLAKATLTAGTGVTVTNGTGTITVAATNNGTVTSVGGTGNVNGITLTGTVTSTGNLTLGGTLAIAATQVTSGTLADARIPSLNTSKITAGTFADARIPSLNTSKITAGTLPVARGGTGLAALGTAGQVLAVNSGATALEYIEPPAPVAPPAFGEAFGGGFFAGQISVVSNGIATHNLVVGPLSTTQSGTTLKYKNEFPSNALAGSQSRADGVVNTAAQVADGNATLYPAAHFCNNLNVGGFSDWYFPAIEEMEVCYFNLKPTTSANNTADNNGRNFSSVPIRDKRTAGSLPLRTVSAGFQSGGANPFAAPFPTGSRYWSSTGLAANNGELIQFTDGDTVLSGVTKSKSESFIVRALRRVPV